MKLYREWLLHDLNKLQSDRKYVEHLTSKLQSLELEFTTLKAKGYDNIPSGICDNYQRDKMEHNLAIREEIQLKLNAVRSHVEYMENLLSDLDPDEREIIEGMIVTHSKTGQQLAEDLFFDVRSIFKKKEDAIENLLRLKFGAGYRP